VTRYPIACPLSDRLVTPHMARTRAFPYESHAEIARDTIRQIATHSPSDRSSANSTHSPGASLVAVIADGVLDRDLSVGLLEPAKWRKTSTCLSLKSSSRGTAGYKMGS